MVLGTWFEAPVTCEACALTLAEPPLLLAPGPEDEEVEYSLADWEVPERVAAVSALADVDIPYRWEPGLVLVVPAVAEEEVDLLLEELGGAVDDDEDDSDGGDDEEADGGESAQNAMSDLFVVADRLQHDPTDPELGTSVTELAELVGESAPPYGIERPVWRRIQALAAAVATALDDGADDEAVAADARSLRDFLRDLV